MMVFAADVIVHMTETLNLMALGMVGLQLAQTSDTHLFLRLTFFNLIYMDIFIVAKWFL